VRIDIGARTDVGCVRELNEDRFRTVPDLNLFVVSDGIGGEAHGEVASEMAVNTIVDHCREAAENPALPFEGEVRPDLSDRTNHLASAVRRANRVIHEASVSDLSLRGMGATVVAAWIDGKRLSLAHVGDSRVYRLRENLFDQLTRDHSLVAEQVRLGLLSQEQAEHSGHQTVLVRALGAEENVDVDLDEHLLLHGDTVLLCSDGLSRMISDEVIANTISELRQTQSATDRLIELAKEAGGADNVTAILIRCQQPVKGLINVVSSWWNRKHTRSNRESQPNVSTPIEDHEFSDENEWSEEVNKRGT